MSLIGVFRDSIEHGNECGVMFPMPVRTTLEEHPLAGPADGSGRVAALGGLVSQSKQGPFNQHTGPVDRDVGGNCATFVTLTESRVHRKPKPIPLLIKFVQCCNERCSDDLKCRQADLINFNGAVAVVCHDCALPSMSLTYNVVDHRWLRWHIDKVIDKHR